MPNRSYVPRNSPPDRRDHFNAHPERVVLAVVSTVVGVLIFAAAIVEDFVPSRSVDSLGLGTSAGIGILLTAGGVAACWGTLTCHGEMRTVWNVLRAGLFALACGWGSYALSVAIIYPSSIIPWLTSSSLAVIFGITFWVTRQKENNLRTLVAPEEC